MLHSLLVKFSLLAATVAVVLWVGWPAPEEEPPPVRTDEPAVVQKPAASPVAKVDLNRASADELQTLPGVGPVLAQRMVEWRKVHGRYRSVDDLQAVKGIGKKRLDQLRHLVTVNT